MRRADPLARYEIPLAPIYATAEDFNWVRRQFRDHLRSAELTFAGELAGEEARRYVNLAVKFYFGVLQSSASRLERGFLVGRAVAHCEAFERVEHGPTLPPEARRVGNAVAQRFVVEYAAQTTAEGREQSLTPEQYRRLLAMANEIVNLGSLSDAIHLQLVEGRVWLDDGGYLCAMFEGDYERIYHAHFAQVWHEKSRRQAARRRDFAVPDDALADEFGVGWDVFLKLIDELPGAVVEDEPAHRVRREHVIDDIHSSLRGHVDAERAAIEKFFSSMTLEPRDVFEEPPAGFDARDILPWRYGRLLSYVRRPFILIPNSHGGDLIWSREHLRTAGRHLVVNLALGEQRVTSPRLASFLNDLRGEDARTFVAEVGELARTTLPEAAVRETVDRFGGTRLLRESGDEIGDIDVFVAALDQRLLLLLECKDVLQGYLPGDVRREFAILEDAVEHATERHAWVEEHLDVVLESLAVQPEERLGWTVESRVVTDERLLIPTFRHFDVEVLSYDEVRAELAARSL